MRLYVTEFTIFVHTEFISEHSTKIDVEAGVIKNEPIWDLMVKYPQIWKRLGVKISTIRILDLFQLFDTSFSKQHFLEYSFGFIIPIVFL
jgi:hypothetical protein